MQGAQRRLKAVYNPLYAVAHEWHVEIQQEPEAVTGVLEMGEKLSFVYWMNCDHCFDFHDDCFFN